MRIIIFLCAFLVSFNGDLMAQVREISGIRESVVDFDSFGNLYKIHVAQKGVGIKYIASLYGVSEEEISKLNGFRDGHILLEGDMIKIPIEKERILSNLNGNEESKDLIALYYIVKPKETLFRIAKVYFEQDITIFQERNNMTNADLMVGQQVLVGWIKSPYQREEDNESLSETIKLYNADLLKDSTLIGVEWRRERAVAYWEKFDKGERGRFYVLHPTARINSMMEIYNPMLRRKVKAKVLGRIPEDTYRKDISILVSPETAKALGALDSRFMVELYYAK